MAIQAVVDVLLDRACASAAIGQREAVSLAALAPSSPVLVDVGANVGKYTTSFLAQAPDSAHALLFEPWMDRIADYGCAALLTTNELRIAGIHRQHVDLKGQFAGIDLQADLPERDRERFLEIVDGVAAALRREGYSGPFGVDAWTYRRADGSIAFHPLGEINARMTFGLVAHSSPNPRNDSSSTSEPVNRIVL